MDLTAPGALGLNRKIGFRPQASGFWISVGPQAPKFSVTC